MFCTLSNVYCTVHTAYVMKFMHPQMCAYCMWIICNAHDIANSNNVAHSMVFRQVVYKYSTYVYSIFHSCSRHAVHLAVQMTYSYCLSIQTCSVHGGVIDNLLLPTVVNSDDVY
jgi:hypothetical protein